MPEWALVVQVLGELDAEAILDVRSFGSEAPLAANTLKMTEIVRSAFRTLAAQEGWDDPFERIDLPGP